MEIKYIVDTNNIQIKEFLKLKGCSRSLLTKVRVRDCLYVNGEKKKNYEIVNKEDVITIVIKEVLNPDFVLNFTPLDILFEDDYFLIVNKPNTVSSQPSRKHQTDNLISMVAAYFKEKNITANIHLVNRLDFSTSGIVIITKSGYMHNLMSKNEISKKYLCRVNGKLANKCGTIHLPIKRINDYDIRRMVDPSGVAAITHYKVLLEKDDYSLVDVSLETGRTHQIRVHMSHIGHPLVGDLLYGKEDKHLYLHCYNMSFTHPITNEVINIINYPLWVKEDLCQI